MKRLNPVRTTSLVLLGSSALALSAWTSAQPAPATRPAATGRSAEQTLEQMLRTAAPTARPLQPAPEGGGVDATSGAGAVAPAAPAVNVLREGSFLVDRTGRLVRSPDGQQWEFHFDADGRTMRDPPVIILPNLKLTAMENAVTAASRDLRFRITGEVTEYRGRNYVLLQKVVVVPDAQQQF